jgi:hypothetical protein
MIVSQIFGNARKRVTHGNGVTTNGVTTHRENGVRYRLKSQLSFMVSAWFLIDMFSELIALRPQAPGLWITLQQHRGRALPTGREPAALVVLTLLVVVCLMCSPNPSETAAPF